MEICIKTVRMLSTCVLDEMVASTGAKKERVWETDNDERYQLVSGSRDDREMGYMTNPEEDRLMATKDYQQKIVTGIADGIDVYFRL